METKPITSPLTLANALVGLYVGLDRVYAAASRDVEITPQQAQLLCVVEYERPALGQLADALGCDKTNVTGLVDRATKRGLVVRSEDDNDRRVKRVDLTDEGRSLVARFHEALKARLSDIEPTEGLSAAGISAIAEQLAGDRES